MHIGFRLPIHNQAYIGDTVLKSNGQVDPQEGRVPAKGISDILDKRVEKFVRSHKGADLGKPWTARTPDEETGEIVASISGNFGKSEPSIASQFLIVNPETKEVTVQTQDAYGPTLFNHWIQASYDPGSGQVNPRTITEWVSG